MTTAFLVGVIELSAFCAKILQLKLLRITTSDDDDATSVDEYDADDFDEVDVNRLRLKDDVTAADDDSMIIMNIPIEDGVLDGVAAPSSNIPDDIHDIYNLDVSIPSEIVPVESSTIDNVTAPNPSVVIPGESDVIVDANCWFVSNCDDDYDDHGELFERQ